MPAKIQVLGVLHIVFGALMLLVGLGAFAFFGGVAGLVQLDGDPDAAIAVPLLGAMGGLILGLLAILSVPGIIAGAGLLAYKQWARILTIVLSVLNLLSFPFGTALGVYGLWVLLSANGSRLFETNQAPSMQYHG